MGQTPKAKARRIGVLLFLLYHPWLLLLLKYISEARASSLSSLGVYPRQVGEAEVFTMKCKMKYPLTLIPFLFFSTLILRPLRILGGLGLLSSLITLLSLPQMGFAYLTSTDPRLPQVSLRFKTPGTNLHRQQIKPSTIHSSRRTLNLGYDESFACRAANATPNDRRTPSTALSR